MTERTYQLAISGSFPHKHLCELVFDLVIARLLFGVDDGRVFVRHRCVAAVFSSERLRVPPQPTRLPLSGERAYASSCSSFATSQTTFTMSSAPPPPPEIPPQDKQPESQPTTTAPPSAQDAAAMDTTPDHPPEETWDDIPADILALSTDEILTRIRLIENDIKVRVFSQTERSNVLMHL